MIKNIEYRCDECSTRLFDLVSDVQEIEIKCPKCKESIRVDIKELYKFLHYYNNCTLAFQTSQYSAMNVTADMTMGIIDRFRCMSISKSAVLIGHTGAGMIRGVISTAVIILTALILGFRPQAGFIDWLLVILLLLLINITVTLIAVLCGMISKSVEGASGLLFPCLYYLL